MIPIFDKEYKVREIGGKLLEDYLHLRGIVLSVNGNHFPIFLLLGLTEQADLGTAIDVLLSPTKESALKRAYIGKVTRGVLEGRIKEEEVLPAKTIKRIAEAEEGKREELRGKELHRNLCLRFGRIYKEYLQTYRPSSLISYFTPLEICREALLLTPSGFGIDVEKFIEIYTDFLACDESTTRQHHQAAAEAINRFFNGVEITQEELRRYFRIEHGAITVNPEAINGKDYLRLGYRGKAKLRRR